MCRLAENIEHVTHAVAHRIHQVIALFGDVLLVADGGQCIHHKVDWHDVDAPAFQPNRGQPRRQQLAHALDQLEKIVGAVDLVHFPRRTVTHHHGGSVNRPGHLALLAHNFFALMLGHEIRVLVVFGLLEHVLTEHAFVQPRRRDRTHMVKMGSVNGFGQLNGVARALNIHGNLTCLVGAQVVHRSQVIKVVDLALEGFDVVRSHTQLFDVQVAKYRHHAGRAHAPVLPQISHLALALLANQKVHHRAFALKQFFDEPLANEAGRTGDEILHEDLQLIPSFLPILRILPFSINPCWHGVPPLEN